MNAHTKIFLLKEEDPAFINGARYAVCRPAWAEWTNEEYPLVALAYLKCETLEDARRIAASGSGVFSTKPGGLIIDQTMIIK